jgi:hypothetical protein
LAGKEYVMGQNILAVRSGTGDFGTRRTASSFGGVAGQALGVWARGNGSMTGGETALTLFGATVKRAIGVGGAVERLEVVEMNVAEALVVKEKKLLGTGEVGVIRVQETNICRIGRAAVAGSTRAISRGGAGGNDHGNIAAGVHVAADIVVAVSQFEPRGLGITLVRGSISRHAVVPGIVLGGEETLVAAFDEVARNTDGVFSARVGNKVPINKAKGGDVEGSTGSLDSAPAVTGHRDADEVVDVKCHGKRTASIKDDGKQFFGGIGGLASKASIGCQGDNNTGVDL